MNSKTKTAAVAGAAATLIAGGIALAPAASAADGCGAGKARVMGQCGVVTVTQNFDSGKPKAGTGGLIFRDDRGNNLGSGMGEGDRFTGTGTEVHINGIKLIEVNQTTKGNGGWGSLYKGYVKAEFADITG